MNQPDLTPASFGNSPPFQGQSVIMAASPGDVRDAIARAAAASGVDFSFLLAEARLESGLNPHARATTSSATGLYQFTDATWAHLLGGQPGAQGALAAEGGPGVDPREDPGLAALMAARLATENRAGLGTALGRAPDAGDVYLAHVLGLDGAVRALTAAATDPGQSAAALMPRAAAANHALFYGRDDDGKSRPRSVGEVIGLLRGRLQAAMGDSSVDSGPGKASAPFLPTMMPDAAPGTTALVDPSEPQGGPIARQFAAMRDQEFAGDGKGLAGAAATPSMAATLASAFGLAQADGDRGGGVPDGVRAAYGRIRALCL